MQEITAGISHPKKTTKKAQKAKEISGSVASTDFLISWIAGNVIYFQVKDSKVPCVM